MTTKHRIEAAAIELFAKQGVDGTAVRDIAQAAGVADGALYRHYRSKDELCRQLFARHYEELGRLFEAEGAKHPHIAGKLSAIIHAVYHLFDTDRALFTFILLTQHDHLPGIGELPATPVDAVCEIIAEAAAKGEIAQTDPAETAAMLFGLALQPAIFTIYGRLNSPLTPRGHKVAEACCRVLGITAEQTEGTRNDA